MVEMNEHVMRCNAFVFLVNADAVNWTEVRVTPDRLSGNVVHIQWPDPPSPNGVILLYELELARADIPNV